MAGRLRSRAANTAAMWLAVALGVPLPLAWAEEGARGSRLPLTPWEATFGMGLCWPFESGVFDLPQDDGIERGFDWVLGARYNLSEHWGIGVRLLASLCETRARYPYVYVEPDTASLDFSVLHYDLEGRYTFSRGRWQPYAFVCAGYAIVDAGNAFEVSFDASGTSAGCGAGLTYLADGWPAIGIEALAATGAASWDELPYPRSSSDKVSPGLVAIHLFIEGRWGRGR